MNEVILLERNPFSAGRSNRITTGRRSSALHAGMWGELFGRWLISIVVGALLLGSVYGSLAVAAGMLFAVWNASPLTHFVALQLAWWLVMGYFTMVRFLSYLDLRIRREGWEVELLMRAEESRLKRHWT